MQIVTDDRLLVDPRGAGMPGKPMPLEPDTEPPEETEEEDEESPES